MDISGNAFTYQFNHNNNGIKIFNVGAGNGVVAKTTLTANFRLNYVRHLNPANAFQRYDILGDLIDVIAPSGSSINWILDAGNSSRPQGVTYGGNVGNNLLQNHQVSLNMADHFCPALQLFRVGVILITHLDSDHYNLIYSILCRCSERYYEYLFGANRVYFNRLIATVVSAVVGNAGAYATILHDVAGIANWGVSNDVFNVDDSFLGYMNALKNGHGVANSTGHAGNTSIQKATVWRYLNRHFSDHKLLWIMPENYDSRDITSVRGFDARLKRVFGSQVGIRYQQSFCTSTYDLAFDHTAVFPRNRIVINNLPNLNRNIQILNRPRVTNGVGTVAGVNKNVNSLMIRLRNNQFFCEKVLILGDAWMATFINHLIDRGTGIGWGEGTILASHHGAETEGSHGIHSLMTAKRVIFSSGSQHHHPRTAAVEGARLTVRYEANVAAHIVPTEGGNATINTQRPIYHTAGTRRIAPGNDYYSV